MGLVIVATSDDLRRVERFVASFFARADYNFRFLYSSYTAIFPERIEAGYKFTPGRGFLIRDSII